MSSSQSLQRETQGLSTVEYLILLVVIAVASVGVWNRIGGSIVKHATKSHEAIRDLSGSAPESGPSGIQERSDDFEDGFGQ